MAERSGFFDAHLTNGEYDRVYLANSFAQYFASFIGNGVFGGKSNELMVQQKASADMSVRVLSGQGWINGYWYKNDDELSLAIDVADGVLNRIDLIVLRWNNVERVIKLAVKKGTPATNAFAPILQRDADYYELKLAQVYVRAGASKITQTDITDTRLDMEVCGFVQGVVKQFDTTEFGKQLDTFIKEFEAENTAKMEDVLGRLEKMAEDIDIADVIIDIKNLQDEAADSVSDITLLHQTLGYTKKNLIPYPYRETTTTVNGVTFTDNGDGTITVNGTPTVPTTVTTFQLNNIKLDPTKRYLITDGTNASQDTYYTQLYSSEATRLPASSANGPVEFIPEDITYLARLVIKTKVSNLVFRPMIRRAEILDNSWEPYALSVTEMIQEDKTDVGCFYRMNRVTKVKEWLNAPNVPGVEYCLTERWNGKPVYQKTFYLSTLPNKTLASLSTNTQWNRVVSIDAFALDSDDLTYYPFPVTLQNQVTPIAVINKIESDGSLSISTTTDASHLKAYITVKYTKS